MRIYDFTLSAGVSYDFSVTGDFFRVLNADAPVRVKFDTGEESEILAGLGYEPRSGSFSRVAIVSEVDQSIKIVTAFGVVHDSRLAGEVALSGALQILQTAATAATVANLEVTGAASVIAPENLNRRSILIRPVYGDVYVGFDAAINTGSGFRVRVGDSLSLETTQDVYAIVGAGNTETVQVLEEIN